MLFTYPMLSLMMDALNVIDMRLRLIAAGKSTSEEMFLMFNLHRPDVLPVDDLGLRNAVALQYNNGEKLTIDEIRKIAEPWAPWRSVATLYLWRSLDPIADY